MTTIEMIKVLQRMDNLIRMRSTGSPDDFAQRLSISLRSLYNYLSLLKKLGAPIRYQHHIESYTYNEDGYLKLEFDRIENEGV